MSARVLIVEDEWLIADLMEAMVVELGYEVIGPACNLEEGLALVESEDPDAAILDVTLGETKSFAIADAMARRGSPFLFVTGYVDGDLPEEYRSKPRVSKPVCISDLRAPLERLTARGEASGKPLAG